MVWLVVWMVLWLANQLAIGFLLVAIDGAWWPFGPRYHVVEGGREDDLQQTAR